MITKMKKAPFKEGKIFADLHVHLPRPKNKKQLTEILNKLTDGIIGVTKVMSNQKILTYEELIDFKDNNFKIKEIKEGVIAKIMKDDKEGYIINTQEVSENINKPHILAIGCKDCIDDRLHYEEIIKKIHELNGLSIITHPYVTVSGDFFKYRLITKKEEDNIKFLCELVDEIETHNGHCIDLAFGSSFWLFKRLNAKKANQLAKELAKQFNRIGIAASDTHFELKQIKTSGIYIPFESDNYLFESLEYNISLGNFEKYEQEVDKISFLKGMFLY